MKTEDFYFELPEDKIAQVPLEKREDSRLLLLNKKTGDIMHKKFSDIIEFLQKGDCLVLNDTRVIPARLFGQREDTGKTVEFLLLKRTEKDKWQTLVKPGKKARVGHKFIFGNGQLKGEIVALDEEGTRIVEFSYDGIFEEILDSLGEMPLPPYITEKLDEKERYQTVYSRHTGSAAAPTAGLHFTEELLEKIREKGVSVCFVTLHVGLGTFRPVKVECIEEHHMHLEYFHIEEETAKIINETKLRGGSVVSVGTTSVRTLESSTDENGLVRAGSGWTDIFIFPGYEFKVVDKLITNFHLPESTLIMLVSALAGKDSTMKAYECAVEENYRFFSFGDAMFIY